MSARIVAIRSGGALSIDADPTDYGLAASTMPMLMGQLLRFDEWSLVSNPREGRFMERFASGAFKKTFARDRAAIRILFDHGEDPFIGRRPIAPLEILVEEEHRGAFYGGRLFDTVATRELVPGLRAGQYGSSFRFSAVEVDPPRGRTQRSAYNPEGLPERTVREAYVVEVGPTPFPVYGSSSATARTASRGDSAR